MKKPGFLVVVLMLFNLNAMKLFYFGSATLCSRTRDTSVSSKVNIEMKRQ